MKTWFITGASRGFGRELTEQLLSRGDRVAATMRDATQLDDLRGEHGDRLWTRELDVTDTTRLREVVDAAFAELGRIDVVVSNAGYGVFGAAEEVTDQQLEGMITTNLTAPMQLARAVTPHLRAQGGGVLMVLSSMGGLMTFPGFSLYHAAKWGTEGFFDSYAQEAAPFGIHTVLVEPGQIRTSFFSAVHTAPPLDAYADNPAAAVRVPIPVETMGGDKAKVVTAMIDAANRTEPPRRLLLGSDAFALVTEALEARLEQFRAAEAVSRSTDIDGFVPA